MTWLDLLPIVGGSSPTTTTATFTMTDGLSSVISVNNRSSLTGEITKLGLKYDGSDSIRPFAEMEQDLVFIKVTLTDSETSKSTEYTISLDITLAEVKSSGPVFSEPPQEKYIFKNRVALTFDFPSVTTGTHDLASLTFTTDPENIASVLSIVPPARRRTNYGIKYDGTIVADGDVSKEHTLSIKLTDTEGQETNY